MRTMFVFQNAEYARDQGFREGIHTVNKEWRACWPGCSYVYLCSAPLEAVIVSAYANVDFETDEGSLRKILRKRQQPFENPIWIEL